MILVDKNFGVVLRTLECLKDTTSKKDLLLSDSFVKVND